MSPENDEPREDGPLEEELITLAAAWDEALGGDRLADSTDTSDLSPEMLSKLERPLACMRLLRQMWPAEVAPPPLRSLSLPNYADPIASAPGTRLGRFLLRRELGRGGFGVVFLAFDPQLYREVALKVPRVDGLFTPELKARFQQEARAAAGLDHPNIVPVHEAGEIGPISYIAYAYCPGITLAEWLRRHPEPVPFADAARLVTVLAEAVEHAHGRGVLHRDLKPANILLVSGGVVSGGVVGGDRNSTPHPSPLTTHQPKITDFGLAKLLDAEGNQTRSGTTLGTPSYMAPEQFGGGGQPAGASTDVYALGAILYELLAGRPPFLGETPLETLQQVQETEPLSLTGLRPKLPRDLETICLKCLQKDPRHRYASAKELAADLNRLLEGRPITARPTGRLERGVRWCRRKPMVAGLLLALVLVFLSGFAGVAWQWRRAELNAIEMGLERDHALASYALARETLGEVMELQEEPRFQEGELEDVRRHLLQAEARFYERFLALRREDPTFRRDRAQARFRLAFVTAELGSAQEALEHYQQAVHLFDALVADFPEEPDYARRLADSLNGFGVLRLELGHGPEALAAFRRAQGLLEQLTNRSPPDPFDEFSLAMTHSNLGRLHASEGRREAAEADFVKARTIHHQLAERHPSNPKYQLEVARTWYRLSSLYQADHRLDDAMQAQALAVPILERLVSDNPEVSAYQAALARSTQVLARLQEANAQRPKAIATQRQALDLFKRLAEKHPRAKSHLDDYAEASGQLGTFCYNSGAYADAEKYHRQAATFFERLQKIDPTAEMDVAKLGGMYCNIGHSLLGRHQFDKALTWYEKGAAALELDAARPRPQRYTREYLIKNCGGRAHALVQLGRHADAIAVLTRGLDLEPQTERPRFLILRGYARARVGELTGAVADTEAGLADSPALPQMVYEAARTYALLSKETLDAPRAEHHARRALELLHGLNAAGFFKEPGKSNLLTTDKCFDPLRSRPDFQEFLSQVAATD